MDIESQLKLLLQAESLQDPDIRKRMQEKILDGADLMIRAAEEPIKARRNSVPSPPRKLGTLLPDSAPAKVLKALRLLATRQRPLSSNDLENMVDGVRNEIINKTLSGLYARKLVCRIKSSDKTAGGSERILFKYYPKETKDEVPN